jgi:hypothetical protein
MRKQLVSKLRSFDSPVFGYRSSRNRLRNSALPFAQRSIPVGPFASEIIAYTQNIISSVNLYARFFVAGGSDIPSKY